MSWTLFWQIFFLMIALMVMVVICIGVYWDGAVEKAKIIVSNYSSTRE